MAITTTLRPYYKWRLILMAIICIVFGLWGVYDYFWAIPGKQRAYDQFRVLESTRIALSSTSQDDDYRKRYTDAIDVVAAEIDSTIGSIIAEQGLTPRSPKEPKDVLFYAMLLDISDGSVNEDARSAPNFDQVEQVATAVGMRKDAAWVRETLLLNQALQSMVRRAPRPPNQAHTGVALAAWERTQAGLDKMGDLNPPSKFDHLMQWGFIICLPFAPYFLWQYWRVRKLSFSLDDEGTLHTPKGAFKRDQIAGINMDRWMSKSVATVKTDDGSEIALDDYIHKNLHLIVGAIAHRFDAELWNEDGTKVKPEDSVAGDDETPEDAFVEAAATDEPSVNERGEAV